MQEQRAYEARREDASLSFKRFILERSRAFAAEPQADLFRVNLLARMLDRYDELRGVGVSEELCVQRVCREFADIPERMDEAGFERVAAHAREDVRWPQISELEAEKYVAQERACAHTNAAGSALCAACCAPLFAASALYEVIHWESLPMLGLIGMFAMIGVAVYMFVKTEKPRMRKEVKRGHFSLSARLRRKLEERLERVSAEARRKKALGVALCVTCIIPLFVGAMMCEWWLWSDLFPILGVSGLFVMVGAGVYEMIDGEGEEKALKRLLKRKK